MNLKTISLIIFLFSVPKIFSQTSNTTRPSSGPPKLPMNIPPPPSFASLANKTGKFQIISAEYYSQDSKPYLYKRLIKYDTSTGEAWVLLSKIGPKGEQRTWVPLATREIK